MSPRVLASRELLFWFHSHDALHEDRASVHVGKGSQDDFNDAKVWLEPEIEVARAGRTLRQQELQGTASHRTTSGLFAGAMACLQRPNKLSGTPT